MRIFLLIPFLFMSFSVFAQENSDGQAIKSKVFAKGTQTLGINAILNPNFFFDKPETLPLEILYRKFTKDDQAIRFRVEGRYEKSINENLPLFEEKWNCSLGVGVGYEWHQKISRQWSWFYGGEVAMTYFWNDEDSTIPSVVFDTLVLRNSQGENRIVDNSVRGLLGFIYSLSSKLLFSVQQGLNISHSSYESYLAREVVPLDLVSEKEFFTTNAGGVFSHTKISFTTKIGFQFKIQ